MIFRNSLKSVLRSPVKSILFFILLLSLTTALTLGSALVGMCSMLIDECNKTYITEASVEYRGGSFPSKEVADETANAIRKQIDFEAVSKLPFVEKMDRNTASVVSVEYFPWALTQTSSQYVFVGVVRATGGSTVGKATKVIYSDSIIDNNGVILNPPVTEESTRFYLITGFTDGSVAGNRPITIGNVVNNVGLEKGVVQEYCMLDVTDDPMLENGDPRYEFFYDAARIYQTINWSTYAVVSRDPGFLEPFVEKEYTFKEGGIYTEADMAEGTCCILPQHIVTALKVNVGDSIKLRVTSTGFCQIIDSYWDESESDDNVISCKVTGIFSTTSKENPMIYVSDLGKVADADEIEGFCGYTMCTLKLRNGVTESELKKLQSILPKGADVSVKDQGYSVVVNMLDKLRSDAIGVTAAAIVATLAMIVLFGYVFVGRQSDALVTMYMMGTSKRSLRTYVTVAAGTVLVPAGVAGCLIAFLFSDYLVSFISKTLSASESVMKLYSTASLGTVTVIEADVSMPVWPGIVCALSIFVTGLVSCLVFLAAAIGKVGAKPKLKKEKTKKTKVTGNVKPLNINGAGLKYVIISFIRGGLRSVAVPLIGILMTLFILVPAAAITVYENKLVELNENTLIKGYLTDYGGKKSYDLVFSETMLDKLREGEYFTDFHSSLCHPYRVYAVRKNGEDVSEGLDMPEAPEGGFALENFVTNFCNGPRLFYTDSVGSTPEFITTRDPEITYLEGYDDSWFELNELPFEGAWRAESGTVIPMLGFKEDKRELCAVVSESMLEKYELKLGDTLILDVSEDIVREEYLIIGSFVSVGSGETIYTRIPNAFKVINLGYDRVGKEIIRAVVPTSFSSCSFKLADTSKILEAKTWLREMGFSRVHSAGFYRIYPVLADREYCDSVEKIEKNIGYLKNVVPALSLLVGLAGFAAAFLMAYRRRVEIATLRSIGQKDLAVFLLFLVEQVVPALIGCGAGIAVFALLAKLNGYSLFAVSFIAGFTAGSLISLLKMAKTNLLDVLSDKE